MKIVEPVKEIQLTAEEQACLSKVFQLLTDIKRNAYTKEIRELALTAYDELCFLVDEYTDFDGDNATVAL